MITPTASCSENGSVTLTMTLDEARRQTPRQLGFVYWNLRPYTLTMSDDVKKAFVMVSWNV
jgi:hypothetical protein